MVPKFPCGTMNRQANARIINTCKNCSAKCCRGLAVVLTLPEAIRMVEVTGLEPIDILQFSVNIDSKTTPHYPLLVNAGKGRAHEVHEYFIIIRREGKDCIFLNDDYTCSVYNDRPLVCRLYPYELDGRTLKKGALCPVNFVREENMEGDAARLKKDLYTHEKLARQWHAKYGREMPDMRRFKEYFCGGRK